MPFWALSFPLAASAALGLLLSPEPGLAQWLASLWLGVVTGVIGALLLATLRGLVRGQLLQPEGTAPLPKAGAEPFQPAGS
jgi:tellurite resistance protein TehA-like permease